MTSDQRYAYAARLAGCPQDQVDLFLSVGVVLQPRQLEASAAARLCDHPDGPTAIGYGGARGGGKSHWLLAQMGADDCQRIPGLKCLLLRKVGKSNLEHFEDLRRRLFTALPHEFATSRGHLTFANGSRIVSGHFQSEKDIDAYLGLEYDVIGVEEATTLTARKYKDISTCCRTSKPNWRPRIYSTTNPGGIGHVWYRALFINPARQRFSPSSGERASLRSDTVFIPARVGDNHFHNPEYTKVLSSLTGWQRRAWFEGDWDIAAGQFFTTFRHDVHVVEDFDDTRAREWFCALDYGFAHYTVCLLGCTDGDGNIFVIDEHAERCWLPQRHAAAIKTMVARHGISLSGEPNSSALINSLSAIGGEGRGEVADYSPRPLLLSRRPQVLARFVAGPDVFSRQCDGTTIAMQYARQGINLRPANSDRINGWADILQRLGDVDAGIKPSLFIHSRCARLIESLPALQHDPHRPEDVLKTDPDDDGVGGDDAADAFRYLVATKPRTIIQTRLRGY